MTDTQLQLAIAKMLPEKIVVLEHKSSAEDVLINGLEPTEISFRWKSVQSSPQFIRQTEWEHIIRLVEEALSPEGWIVYLGLFGEGESDFSVLKSQVHASWQQRATAILKVKGVV